MRGVARRGPLSPHQRQAGRAPDRDLHPVTTALPAPRRRASRVGTCDLRANYYVGPRLCESGAALARRAVDPPMLVARRAPLLEPAPPMRELSRRVALHPLDQATRAGATRCNHRPVRAPTAAHLDAANIRAKI